MNIQCQTDRVRAVKSAEPLAVSLLDALVPHSEVFLDWQ